MTLILKDPDGKPFFVNWKNILYTKDWSDSKNNKTELIFAPYIVKMVDYSVAELTDMIKNKDYI